MPYSTKLSLGAYKLTHYSDLVKSSSVMLVVRPCYGSRNVTARKKRDWKWHTAENKPPPFLHQIGAQKLQILPSSSFTMHNKKLLVNNKLHLSEASSTWWPI